KDCPRQKMMLLHGASTETNSNQYCKPRQGERRLDYDATCHHCPERGIRTLVKCSGLQFQLAISADGLRCAIKYERQENRCRHQDDAHNAEEYSDRHHGFVVIDELLKNA